MTEAALVYVNKLLQSININYEYMRYSGDTRTGAYFVGEYIESPRQENGFQESTFILRGYTRSEWLYLERAKADIEANVGKTAILSDGTGIAIFYDSAMTVPTGDAELKSIKINLKILEWRADI